MGLKLVIRSARCDANGDSPKDAQGWLGLNSPTAGKQGAAPDRIRDLERLMRHIIERT
jgi:hypothetical protein